MWIFHLSGNLLRAYPQLAYKPVLKEKTKPLVLSLNTHKQSITSLSLGGSEEQLSSQ